MNFAQFFSSNGYYMSKGSAYFLKAREDEAGNPILLSEKEENKETTGISQTVRNFIDEQGSSRTVCFMRLDIVLGRKIFIIYPQGYDMRQYAEYLQRVSLTYLLTLMSCHGVTRDLAQKDGALCRSMIQQAELLYGNQTLTKTIGWVNVEECVTCICLGYDTTALMIRACIPQAGVLCLHNEKDERQVRELLRIKATVNGMYISQAISCLKG